MKLSAVAAALAIGGGLAFSGQAMADKVKATYTDMSAEDYIEYDVEFKDGSTITNRGTYTGIFNFEGAQNIDDVSPVSGPIDLFNDDQFVSFCIDLEDTIGPGHHEVTWQLTNLADAPDANAGPMGATKANDIAKVLGYTIDSGRLNDARFLSNAKAQAVQAVIWEIVHEKSTNSYDLASGTARFRGLTSGALHQVDGILAGFGSATAMQGLVGLSKDGKQDFIGQVPIPAAAWLFGSALVGTAALGRRRGRDKAKAKAAA